MPDMVKRVSLAAIGVLVLAFAAAAPVQAKDAKSSVYLSAGSVDGAKLIGPPPAADSAEHRTQMAIVLWLQRTRTPAQVAFVEKTLNVERFAPILAADLFTVDGIALKATIDAVIDEVRADYDALKAKYGEPRPFTVNKAVRPVGDARPVAAYPSGHATRAVVYARLLAEIFPDKKGALMELAMQVGYGRVIAGVHYPMDVLAGQKLGNAYADVIVKQPAFKQAVQRIRGK